MLLSKDYASLLQLGTLGQQVVLLQANDRARAADADVAYGLLSCEVMVLNEVAADQHTCAPQAGLAVNCQRPCT